MTSSELLRIVFKKCNNERAPEDTENFRDRVARRFGISVATVKKWTEPITKNGRKNPLDELEVSTPFLETKRLFELTGDRRIIEWVTAKMDPTAVADPSQKEEQCGSLEGETMTVVCDITKFAHTIIELTKASNSIVLSRPRIMDELARIDQALQRYSKVVDQDSERANRLG